MRARAPWLVAQVVVVGCCPTPVAPPAPAPCGLDAGTADAAAAACGPGPVRVDPATVESMSEFRAAASAIVCERALACGRSMGGWWALAESYCHPAFAELAARRSGAADAIDLPLARASLAALVDAPSCEAAWDAALRCQAIAEGGLGEACTTAADCPRASFVWGGATCRAGMCALAREGEACAGLCEPGLDCVGGRCVARFPRLAACADHGDCARGLACVGGRCDLAPLGGACGVTGSCVPGAACSGGRCLDVAVPGDCCAGRCDVGECVDGRCVGIAPIGCPCDDDRGCPLDVSRCVDGACRARPFLGDACPSAALPCFGAVCDAGTCRRPRLGEACFADTDCDGGLVCAPDVGAPCEALLCIVPRLACGPLLGLGEPCELAGVFGRCADGLSCGEGHLCGPGLGAGAPCGDGAPGRCDPATLFCDTTAASPTCAPRSRLGQLCTSRPCVPELVCEEGLCARR